MIELIIKGGIFMYPIIFCSIVALGVFLERLWVLRRKKIIPEDFIRNVEDLLRKRKLSEAVFLCQSDMSSIAKIFLAGLRNTGKGMWLVKQTIEERGTREATVLEKNVGILSTVANLSPLLGLLGTVSGMIKTFNAISVQGIGNPAPLAGGIAEALITTAAGLCVAIPTLVCYRFVKDKASSLIFEMEENSIRLVELMEKYSEGKRAI
ncbi:MAG: MotA/TolQ/ExbB proton channel family protein [Deltaproteobacteria bacterium]|nr:MotA/TolQ/ExbB proton channel family protein [Deltaproteobacteria bacterium]MBW1929445.1 MotA/TolQ/ExbB proton channel family protein [Deltaproteobacteria bacterium]MBW2023896.1 MotA/TolQ/ExbB proton channel family protein [Deltaproteobacteria bacterium]MBW2124185.1 MotA/TolQ/ExbB proton channel family protein [Deltaproteobacteria bacterium]RLB24747.1 MAG: MotA/TolQ/ExbB proton channel family protein [Deltaproteobacteria bacterium]